MNSFWKSLSVCRRHTNFSSFLLSFFFSLFVFPPSFSFFDFSSLHREKKKVKDKGKKKGKGLQGRGKDGWLLGKRKQYPLPSFPLDFLPHQPNNSFPSYSLPIFPHLIFFPANLNQDIPSLFLFSKKSKYSHGKWINFA